MFATILGLQTENAFTLQLFGDFVNKTNGNLYISPNLRLPPKPIHAPPPTLAYPHYHPSYTPTHSSSHLILPPPSGVMNVW